MQLPKKKKTPNPSQVISLRGSPNKNHKLLWNGIICVLWLQRIYCSSHTYLTNGDGFKLYRLALQLKYTKGTKTTNSILGGALWNSQGSLQKSQDGQIMMKWNCLEILSVMEQLWLVGLHSQRGNHILDWLPLENTLARTKLAVRWEGEKE